MPGTPVLRIVFLTSFGKSFTARLMSLVVTGRLVPVVPLSSALRPGRAASPQMVAPAIFFNGSSGRCIGQGHGRRGCAHLDLSHNLLPPGNRGPLRGYNRRVLELLPG